MLYLPSTYKGFGIFPIIESISLSFTFQWFNFYLMMLNLIKIMITCWCEMSIADEWIWLKMINFILLMIKFFLSFRCSFNSLVSLMQHLWFLSFRKTNQRTRWHVHPWTFSMKRMGVWNERPRYLKDFVLDKDHGQEECHILPSYYPSETLIYNTSTAIIYSAEKKKSWSI